MNKNKIKKRFEYNLMMIRHRLMSLLPESMVLKFFATEQEKNLLAFLKVFNTDDNFVIAGESRYSDVTFLDHVMQLDILHVSYISGGGGYSDA